MNIKKQINRVAQKAIVIAVTATFVLLGLFPVVSVQTGVSFAAEKTLSISAGYYGMGYEFIKEFDFDELESLDLERARYSYQDMSPAPRRMAAEGIWLWDLIEYAGIDPGSVQRVYFKTSDDFGSDFEYTAQNLFEFDRYYYPNLVEGWDKNTNKPTVDAIVGKVEVKPMIAIRSFLAEKWDSEPSFDKIDDSNGYRFCQGMTSIYDVGGAMRSLHSIIEIKLQFVGSSPLEKEPIPIKDPELKKEEKPMPTKDSELKKEEPDTNTKPKHESKPDKPITANPENNTNGESNLKNKKSSSTSNSAINSNGSGDSENVSGRTNNANLGSESVSMNKTFVEIVHGKTSNTTLNASLVNLKNGDNPWNKYNIAEGDRLELSDGGIAAIIATSGALSLAFLGGALLKFLIAIIFKV
ncbi:MAG: hypothetical protein LBD41_01140 [Clostridiales Family XIII bacterium]|jgi:hypothetical protein|nr:hypothetical protein [Clostridiales Family XIII bacterium]